MTRAPTVPATHSTLVTPLSLTRTLTRAHTHAHSAVTTCPQGPSRAREDPLWLQWDQEGFALTPPDLHQRDCVVLEAPTERPQPPAFPQSSVWTL